MHCMGLKALRYTVDGQELISTVCDLMAQVVGDAAAIAFN